MPFRGRTVALATGVGNVRSVVRALDRVASNVVATADAEEVRGADVLVVPGQGSFGAFAAALDGGLREVLLERIRGGTPYFGICLGLQILFDDSEEAPGAKGLGVLTGSVKRLAPGHEALPHMGWNRAERSRSEAANVFESAHFYFAHTFAAVPADPSVTLATTTYGTQTFTSAVASGAIVGVQFHPEKSQRAGLGLIERFFESL
jgi:glutamine amidotransferase